MRRPYSDIALWLACCLPIGWELLRGNGSTSWPVIAGAPLLAAAFAVSRARPLLALGVPVALSLSLTLELFNFPFSLAMLVLSYLLGRRIDTWRPALAAFTFVSALGFVLVVMLTSDPWAWITLVTTVLFNLVYPWLLGRYRRHYAELVRTGWNLADRMEREQHIVAAQTRLRERSRIASDMHDSLGHELSLIALRAGALEVAPGLDAAHQEAAGELRIAAATATERLREIIGVLREDGEQPSTTPATETVAALVSSARLSGVSVDLAEAGDTPLPPMVDRAMYRVVQESLTNATKHAPGAHLEVQLSRYADGVTVTVTNSPPSGGPLPGVASSGTGLVGLDERVRLAGGVLSAGPCRGGFEVHARFHLEPGAAVHTEREPANTAAREFERVRGRVRRGLWEALLVPVAIAAGIGLLMLGVQYYTSQHSSLDSQRFEALRVGEPEDAVLRVLPRYQLEDPPAVPAGSSCRHYRAGTSTAYRLCFTNGSLSGKDLVHLHG